MWWMMNKKLEWIVAVVLAMGINVLWRQADIWLYGIHQESIMNAVVCGVLGAVGAHLIGRLMDDV